MLTSISPLGERARGNRWTVTVAWLVLGAAAGGGAVGAVLGTLGQGLALLGGDMIGLDGRAPLAVLAAACAAAAVWDFAGLRIPGRRQVNEDWLVAYRPWVYGSGFGLQLGAAVATVVNTAVVPLFMLAAVLSGGAGAGMAIGAVFGAVRGASLLMARRVRTTDDLRRLHRRIDRHAETARRVTAALSAALAGAGAASLSAL